MKWRRLCVDVGYSGEVLGASAELFDDTTAGCQSILVASGGEVCHLSPPGCLQYLYDNYKHIEQELPFEEF
jgi:hypothetical protein